jgi:hypothetical protein
MLEFRPFLGQLVVALALQAAAAAIYYNGDKAHFTLMGATLMARYATQELVRIGSPLGDYVN